MLTIDVYINDNTVEYPLECFYEETTSPLKLTVPALLNGNWFIVLFLGEELIAIFKLPHTNYFVCADVSDLKWSSGVSLL